MLYTSTMYMWLNFTFNSYSKTINQALKFTTPAILLVTTTCTLQPKHTHKSSVTSLKTLLTALQLHVYEINVFYTQLHVNV